MARWKIQLFHPETGEKLEFEADGPDQSYVPHDVVFTYLTEYHDMARFDAAMDEAHVKAKALDQESHELQMKASEITQQAHAKMHERDKEMQRAQHILEEKNKTLQTLSKWTVINATVKKKG